MEQNSPCRFAFDISLGCLGRSLPLPTQSDVDRLHFHSYSMKNWKIIIKKFLPVFPFIPTHRAQILENKRSDYHPNLLKFSESELPYYFRPATYEQDYEDIVAAYPDELGLVDTKERREVIEKRFLLQHPCFVIRDKKTDQLLGAMWASPGGFDFLPNQEKYQGKKIYTQVNSFIIPERRGGGIGKHLKFWTIDYLFSKLSADYIHSLVQDYRLPSMIINLKAGFKIIGTHYQQHFLGLSHERFVRKNTNPFFNSFKRIPVVITAADGANPLGIARSLGRKGVPVYILAYDSIPCLKWSRYVKGIINVSSLAHTEELKEGFDELLRDIKKKTSSSAVENSTNGDTKPILIVTNEEHYHFLSPLGDYISKHFEMMTPLDKAATLSEKQQQFPLAEKAGFRVLQTVVLRSPSDMERVEDCLTFPVIVRPSRKNTSGGFEKKTELYETCDEMKSSLHPILSENGVSLIAQEYVPGTDRDVVFFMASCDAMGEPRTWLSGRKWRQSPPGRGLMASGIIDRKPDPDFVEKSKELCRLFALRGFIGIECKQNPETNEYCYIESSIRPEGTNAIGLAAGVDLVLQSYLATQNFPCGEVSQDELHGSWASFELDYASMKMLKAMKDSSWWNFFVPLPRPIAYPIFSWTDPLPFFCSLSNLVITKIQKLLGLIPKRKMNRPENGRKNH